MLKSIVTRFALVLVGSAAWLACTEPTFDTDVSRSQVADGDVGDGVRFDAGAVHVHKHDAEQLSATAHDAAPPTSVDQVNDALVIDPLDSATAPHRADTGPPAFDASASGPGLDAAPHVGMLPAWATPMLGAYAKRTISLFYDPLIAMPVGAIEMSRVRVSAADDGTLTMPRCVRSARNGGTGTQPWRSRIPKRFRRSSGRCYWGTRERSVPRRQCAGSASSLRGRACA